MLTSIVCRVLPVGFVALPLVYVNPSSVVEILNHGVVDHWFMPRLHKDTRIPDTCTPETAPVFTCHTF